MLHYGDLVLEQDVGGAFEFTQFDYFYRVTFLNVSIAFVNVWMAFVNVWMAFVKVQITCVKVLITFLHSCALVDFTTIA